MLHSQEWTSQVVPVAKNPQETQVQSLGGEDLLEEGMANPPQYSCLENPMDRGAWRATVHNIAESQTGLK